MRKILKILSVERYVNRKTGQPFYRTYALVEGDDEVVGYGNDYQVNELVEVFHDTEWDVSKMQKPKASSKNNLDDKIIS